MWILTPVDLKPLKILLQKLDILITLQGATHMPNFMGRPKGVRPTNSWNIKSCDFVYTFPSLSFLFSCRRLEEKLLDNGRILSINTSNDAFSAKDVPFGVTEFKFNI